MNITRYQNLEEINIILFNRILTTNKYELLSKESREFNEIEKEYLFSEWVKLYDQYFIEKNDQAGRAQLRALNKRLTLTKKIEQVVILHNALVMLYNVQNELKIEDLAYHKASLLDTLKDIDKSIRVNVFDSLEDICNHLNSVIKSYNNQLNEMGKVENRKEEKSVNRIYDSIVSIQNVLGYYIGKAEDISVMEYIALERSAKAKVEQQKQSNGKK